MDAFVEKKINGHKTQVIVTDDPQTAPITDYTPYVDCVKETEAEFDEYMDAFFKIALDDERIQKAAKDWEKSASILTGYALSLFNMDKDNDELRKYALQLLDRLSKTANMRRNNMAQHRKLMIGKHPGDEKVKDQATEAKHLADTALIRSANTQAHYIDLYQRGECYAAAEQKKEAERAARAEERRKMIPDDVLHIPGRIYPPVPIPVGERVPSQPLPYHMYKAQPLEAMEYNRELDEFVLKPGYVSPDGLIDADSVIRDRKNHQVIMKFRGGEPVIWPEWKATWAGDIPDEDSWIWQYYLRMGEQEEADKQMRMFERQPYEEDTPWYNKTPEELAKEE